VTSLWPHGDPRDVARSIVADPRYRLTPAPPAQKSWFDLLADWLAGVIRAALHAIDHLLGSHNPFGVAIGGIVIVAIGALVVTAVVLLVRATARRGSVSAGAAIAARVRAAVPTSTELRSAARAAAAGGRYREAAALLFAAAARALDERGRLPFDPARTPGEYRRLLRDVRFDALAGAAVVAQFAAAEPRDDSFELMNAAYDGFFEDGPVR
jgi:hypothetical protein